MGVGVTKGLDVKCSIEGCPGDYEQRRVSHTVRREGELVVIDGVPAEVCPACGDVLFSAGTVRALQRILEGRSEPAKKVPLYDYAE